MAQGSKYSDEQRENALALLTTKSITQVSKETKIPYTTLLGWTKSPDKINPNFKEVRDKKKQQFVERAWNIIEKADLIMERKLNRTLIDEDKLDELIDKARGSEKLTSVEVRNLINAINSVKSENIGQLSTVIGTMYDKQALANKEATVNHGLDKSVEDVLKELAGDEM